MSVTYRCLRCGNNSSAQPDVQPYCTICNIDTLLVVVTEQNKDKLPFPTDPPRVFDEFDPSKTCQCRAGTCPCGAFVAHKITEPCNSHEFIS